jgi:signal transduction histidine kinase
VLEVQEMERRRVAIELHDELGQSLTAIKINLQLGERLKDKALAELNRENIRIVEDALQQVRRLATTLRPSMLDDLGLAAALQWITEQSASRGGFSVKFHHVRAQARLAPDIETACFRIVQEALTNIARHAQASQVDIRLDRQDDTLVLLISDDGCGFAQDEMQARALAGNSTGVLGMQERATLIGGQLTIQSSPGNGSIVQMRCPWRTHEETL